MHRNNPDPIISVITICLNVETYIKRTMESVLNQTYPNIEYIIVDGKSTDNTIEIVRNLKKAYPTRGIKIISETDTGIADAMNKGVLAATGKIITHLHSGDYYIDNAALEKVISTYRGEGWRWAVAGSVMVDGKGRKRHIFRANPDHKTLLKKNCIPHQSSFLVKDIFETHGLFDIEYKQAMDYDFWLRLIFICKERYVVLPFETTYFLEGGKSSNVYELLKYLRKIRKSLQGYEHNITLANNFIFYSKVFLFSLYYKLKKF